VAAVAAGLGINRLIVVGYSMGGLIAQLLWQRHRQLTCGCPKLGSWSLTCRFIFDDSGMIQRWHCG
jgi:pimeloyl-ACP methyl ester carboxylesterase